ncbi:outer membrane beta-barrel protein [bacterium]|nr:outer membrane beta-barrel protein [bacterium]
MQESVPERLWFAGASFGQIYDATASIDTSPSFNEDLGNLDMNMYSLHVGRRFNAGMSGFDASLYLEVAYLDGDQNFSLPSPAGIGLLDQYNADVQIIPVTLNGMIERRIYEGLGVYLGGGLGYGFTEVDVFNASDSDGGFYAQVSAGLNYKFTETFEIFGGGRWVYLDSLDFGNSTFELDDGFAWEAGLRFNF